MEREEYLQKQQELRERRAELNRINREVSDKIRQEHRRIMEEENLRYEKLMRQQKNSYDTTVYEIEGEQMRLKVLWYEQHPGCPAMERKEVS